MTSPIKTPWHSLKSGSLSEGCRMCVEGRKLVLFITGLCPQRCFYCPVSEKKFGKDVVYANEWKIKDPENPEEMLEEARLTEAKGAGITGGDPLAKTERCCKYIKLLKKEFGKDFHIHLYTPLKLLTIERLQKLYEAGLDEIRLHPDLDDDLLWDRIDLAKKFDWAAGIEIPLIPGYEDKTKKLIDYAAEKIDFINFNELELSDTETKHYKLLEKGYFPKDSVSYGVKGSSDLAFELIRYSHKKGLSAHFCTVRLKDSVQMKKRLEIRAKNIALPFDKITEDGTLIRGCAYLPELKPDFGYREKLKISNREQISNTLMEFKKKLIAKGFKETEIAADSKLRLLIPPDLAKSKSAIIKQIGLVPAIVEEDPTSDSIELEVEFF